jgi:SAM-dependent methyltransferase
MVSAEFADHFSGHASQYADYRPTYPPALTKYLASIAPARKLAWDCGTGSGQAAILLGDEFDRVVATDPSGKQLEHATKHAHVEYHVGREAQSGLADASCDLVTAAQAAHWFDLPAFYAEVHRVLRPGGVLALWCYVRTHVSGDIDPVIRWFQFERVGKYWPAGREHVDAGYRTLLFPYPRLEAPAFEIERAWTRHQLCDYVGTWSAVTRARAEEGNDPLDEFRARLAPLWPVAAETRRIHWPIDMLISRLP